MITDLRGAPAAFRVALAEVPPGDRDAWLDRELGLGELPDDGPALPSGCVPYLPCSVDTIVEMVERAEVGPADVFVDVGAGLGRAAVLVHLLTGASAIGLEIQPQLVQAARELTLRLELPRVAVLEGDAVELADHIAIGSVFFLYCPFSGARVARLLDVLAAIARARTIRICCVDLPLPEVPWLTPIFAPPSSELAIFRSRR